MAKVSQAAESEYSEADADDLSWIKGKILLCTGITDGLGLAGIGNLCASSSKPEHVIFMARTPKKAEGVKHVIESNEVKCTVVKDDSSKPEEVIVAAREVEKVTDQMHCIWNHEGIWTSATEVQRQEDELEMHFATNCLAMTVLIKELESLIVQSAPSLFSSLAPSQLGK